MLYNRVQIRFKTKGRFQFKGLLDSLLISKEKATYNKNKRRNFYKNYKNKNKQQKIKFRRKAKFFNKKIFKRILMFKKKKKFKRLQLKYNRKKNIKQTQQLGTSFIKNQFKKRKLR